MGEMCRLTFELTGPARHGAWPARRRINEGASRARRYAAVGPVERLVSRHCGLAVRRRTMKGGRGIADGYRRTAVAMSAVPSPVDRYDGWPELAHRSAAIRASLTTAAAGLAACARFALGRGQMSEPRHG